MGKYFGTDGVRGVAGDDLNAELVYKLGRYGGYVLTKHKEGGNPKILIARDTRLSCDMFSSAIKAGLLSVGCSVLDIGVMPTPAASFLVKDIGFDAGVMLSASHNSYEYNGIKFFDSNGFKLTDEIEDEIENYLDGIYIINTKTTHEKLGEKLKNEKVEKKYINHLFDSIDEDLSSLNILLDTANGACFDISKKVFKGRFNRLDIVNDNPNGININKECGSTYIDKLSDTMKKGIYDLGISFDGDGDRMLAIDKKGRVLDGDKIIFIIASYLREKLGIKDNTIVVTVMSNLGFTTYAKKHGFKIKRTKVGDRYVLEEMLKSNYTIGGEQSGHVIVLPFANTGDGILSALLLCASVVYFNKGIDIWNDEIPKYPQILKNANVPNEKKSLVLSSSYLKERIEQIESILNDEGRILVRASGTEPLIRVMLEGKELSLIDKYADELLDIINDIVT